MENPNAKDSALTNISTYRCSFEVDHTSTISTWSRSTIHILSRRGRGRPYIYYLDMVEVDHTSTMSAMNSKDLKHHYPIPSLHTAAASEIKNPPLVVL